MDDGQKIKELIQIMVGPLVTKPQQLKISYQPRTGEFEFVLELATVDIGRVIGRQGRVISALRILLNSLDFSNHQLIKLDIKGDKKLS
jgi:predicted RNA-binding protein YlqC (UPF0109 family)